VWNLVVGEDGDPGGGLDVQAAWGGTGTGTKKHQLDTRMINVHVSRSIGSSDHRSVGRAPLVVWPPRASLRSVA